MADQPIVHIGENSPEEVAYKLFHDLRADESERKKALDFYAECLETVRNPHQRGKAKPFAPPNMQR
jgi:hypothetical protein